MTNVQPISEKFSTSTWSATRTWNDDLCAKSAMQRSNEKTIWLVTSSRTTPSGHICVTVWKLSSVRSSSVYTQLFTRGTRSTVALSVVKVSWSLVWNTRISSLCNVLVAGFYRKDHLRKHTRSHIARRLKAGKKFLWTRISLRSKLPRLPTNTNFDRSPELSQQQPPNSSPSQNPQDQDLQQAQLLQVQIQGHSTHQQNC